MENEPLGNTVDICRGDEHMIIPVEHAKATAELNIADIPGIAGPLYNGQPMEVLHDDISNPGWKWNALTTAQIQISELLLICSQRV